MKFSLNVPAYFTLIIACHGGSRSANGMDNNFPILLPKIKLPALKNLLCWLICQWEIQIMIKKKQVSSNVEIIHYI